MVSARMTDVKKKNGLIGSRFLLTRHWRMTRL